jgi:hypothetical protein
MRVFALIKTVLAGPAAKTVCFAAGPANATFRVIVSLQVLLKSALSKNQGE